MLSEAPWVFTMLPILTLCGYDTVRLVLTHLACVPRRYEDEVSRWRRGETVPEAEQLSSTKVTSGPSKDDSLRSLTPTPHTGTLTPHSSDMGRGGFRLSVTPTPETSRAFEEEKAKLCQQIDEKVYIAVSANMAFSRIPCTLLNITSALLNISCILVNISCILVNISCILVNISCIL